METVSATAPQRKKEKLREISGLATVLVATAALTWAVSSFIISPSPHYYALRTTDDLEMLDSKITTLQNEVRLQEMLSKNLRDVQPTTLQIAKLTSEVDVLQAQVKGLNDAIGESPTKAIALPLLQKDVDDLRTSLNQESLDTQGEINRIYDQNKWFIGLMITMALALLGMGLSNFLRKA